MWFFTKFRHRSNYLKLAENQKVACLEKIQRYRKKCDKIHLLNNDLTNP